MVITFNKRVPKGENEQMTKLAITQNISQTNKIIVTYIAKTRKQKHISTTTTSKQQHEQPREHNKHKIE